MTTVRKSTGLKEEYDEDKVVRSIQKAAIDAGYGLDDVSSEVTSITSIINEMASEKQEINAEAIRDNVLKELEKTKPEVAQAWYRFDEKYKGI
ncbi:MAG TPA: ATP cone domain-containing protein [Methanobacterium sp.]|nr:ATP cone domain-containing protein [Methanobacterium sp.]